MAQKQQSQDVYDQIFDFVFESQKNPPSRKPPPTKDEFIDILLDIGMNPSMVPVEQVMGGISDALFGQMTLVSKDKVKIGLGKGALTDPQGSIRKGVQKESGKRLWTNINGGVSSAIDGPYLALLAKLNGIDSKYAMELGRLVTMPEKMGNLLGRGYAVTKGKYYDIKDKEYKNGLVYDKNAKAQMNKYRENIISMYENEISRLQDLSQKYGTAPLNVKSLQSKLDEVKKLEWDTPNYKDNYNKFVRTATFTLTKSALVRRNFEKARDYDSKIEQQRGFFDANLRNLESTSNRLSSLQNELKSLNNRLNMTTDPGQRELLIRDMREIQKDYQSTYRNVNKLSSYGNRLDRELKRLGEEQSRYVGEVFDDKLLNNLVGTGKRPTLGARANSMINTVSWITQGGYGDNFFSGEWDKIGIAGGIGLSKQLTSIVEERELTLRTRITKDGETVFIDKTHKGLSYMESSNTLMGKLIGDFYYLHPTNFVKGLISGQIWLKLNKRGFERLTMQGKDFKKSFAYFLYSAAPGRMLNDNLLLGYLKEGFNKIVPSTQGIKSGLRKVLQGLLGVNPIAGLLVTALINMISDELVILITTSIIAMGFGVIAFLYSGRLGRSRDVAGVQTTYMVDCVSNIDKIVDSNPFPNSKSLCYYLKEEKGTEYMESIDFNNLPQDEAEDIQKSVNNVLENPFTD